MCSSGTAARSASQHAGALWRAVDRMEAAAHDDAVLVLTSGGGGGLRVPVDGTIALLSRTETCAEAGRLVRHGTPGLDLAMYEPVLFWNVVWYGGGPDAVRRTGLANLVARLAPLETLAVAACSVADTIHSRRRASPAVGRQ